VLFFGLAFPLLLSTLEIFLPTHLIEALSCFEILNELNLILKFYIFAFEKRKILVASNMCK